MATPALHSIIVDTHAQNKAIGEYFRIKKHAGIQAVPEPLLNGPVIAELESKLKDSSNAITNVRCVILCLTEFSSNAEHFEPWRSFHKEVACLISGCLDIYAEVRSNDFSQKTSIFLDECIRPFNKLCDVISYAGNDNEPFSTLLFNLAASDFFSLLVYKGLGPAVFAIVVRTLSSLCHYANKDLIADNLKNFSIHLKLICRKYFQYDVECQVNVYLILHTSLKSKEEAKEMAAIWFHKWPALVDTFVDCFHKGAPEGAGIFTSKVYEIGVQASSSVKPNKISTGMSESQRDTSAPKSHVAHSSNLNTQTSHVEPGLVKNKLKGIQTPFYPDRRKCLSLRTTKNALAAERPNTTENYNHKDAILKKNKECRSQKVSLGQSTQEIFAVPLSNPRKNKQSRSTVLSLLDHENDESKVSRWLKESSCEYSSSDVDPWKPSHCLEIASDMVGKNKAIKRKSSEVPSDSKRRKEASSLEGKVSHDIGQSMFSTTIRASAYHKTKPLQDDVFDRSQAAGIAEDLPVRHRKVVTIESECEVAGSKAKDQQKRKLPLFSKANEESGQEGSVLKGSILHSLNLKGSHVKTNRHLNHWEQKLWEFENGRETEKKADKDVYQFTDNYCAKIMTSVPNQEPRGFAKKSTAATGKTKTIAPGGKKLCKGKPQNGNNKENVSENVCGSIRRDKRRTEKIIQSKQVSDTGTKLQSKKATGYTPIADDSMEIPKPQDKSLSTEVSLKAAHHSKAANESKCYSVPMDRASRMTGSKRQMADVKCLASPVSAKVENAATLKDKLGSHDSTWPLKQMANQEYLIKSPVTAQVKNSKLEKELSSIGRYKSPPSTFSKCNTNASNVDSGLEVTSDSTSLASKSAGDHVPAAPKKESSLCQFLKMRMSEYLKNAATSNSELSKNQSEMTTEMVEIKGLAEKIAASAGRCQTVFSNQQNIIGVQAESLQKCTKHFTSYVDSRELNSHENIARKLKARNTQRLLEAVKTVIENNYSLTSSDSE